MSSAKSFHASGAASWERTGVWVTSPPLLAAQGRTPARLRCRPPPSTAGPHGGRCWLPSSVSGLGTSLSGNAVSDSYTTVNLCAVDADVRVYLTGQWPADCGRRREPLRCPHLPGAGQPLPTVEVGAGQLRQPLPSRVSCPQMPSGLGCLGVTLPGWWLVLAELSVDRVRLVWAPGLQARQDPVVAQPTAPCSAGLPLRKGEEEVRARPPAFLSLFPTLLVAPQHPFPTSPSQHP